MPPRRRLGKRGKKYRVGYARNVYVRAGYQKRRFGQWNINNGQRMSQVPKRIGQTREVPGPGSLIPKTKLMNLKYAFEFSLNAGAAACAAYIIRANNCFDPEQVLGGHSAFYFDEMMRFYGKWRVVSSKMRIWYINPAVSDQIPFYVTVLRSRDGLMYQQFASSAHLLEAPSAMRGNVKICGQFSGANQVSQNSTQAATCNATYSQRKFFPGIKDEGFEGLYNQSIADLYTSYYEIVQFPLAGDNPPLAYFRGEILFNVLFSEPLLLPESGVTNAGFGLEGQTGPQGAINVTMGVSAGFTGHGGPASYVDL